MISTSATAGTRARTGFSWRGLREPPSEPRTGWAPDPGFVCLSIPYVMTGIAEVLKVVTEPGDAVVISPPVYPPFFSTIVRFGRRVVEAPLVESANGWELDLDSLERAFAAGARAYLLCNPHNPIGQVFSREKLEAVDGARRALRDRGRLGTRSTRR